MRTAVYPGTFDPVTLGHLDIIARAARLFDRLVIGVSTNPGKTPLFSLDERIALMEAECAAFAGAIVVKPFEGLVTKFAEAEGAVAIVRGLRSGTDFDYENQMAQLNRGMAGTVESVFLMAAAALQPVSSSFVREIGRMGGDIAPLVTATVERAVLAKLGR
ncbi:pantetheine-phosphate adenylyltransferase [Sphingomonas naphthae]|uniref:Phosphopantetheine adenylyltransferase n=1 Tax=Sphingomonas naphthae TaxID=1813468 RepID=A0ABY7TS79_9SPHN|nr:pantetheine-phosphate adenylyltransferase [Sphingomonas naphthae]WCT75265.1 pantetheine-phosphate adenylyltransferase [Sphingomonas naphthae]